MIARRESRATSVALRCLDDRELRDIGLYRDCVGNISDMYGDLRIRGVISNPTDVR